MKYYVSLLTSVVCFLIIDFRVQTKEIKFNVSSLVGKEDVYFHLKRRRPSVRHPIEEKLKIKEKVCQAVLESNFFDSHNVALVNPRHPDIHDHVKQHHPKVHKKYYEQGHHTNESKFTNPYSLHDIFIHGKAIREWLFLCLTKNHKTNALQQYYISPMHHTTDGKVVRFVFTHNNKNEMVVIARAEGISTVHHHVQGHETTTVQTTLETTTTKKTTTKSSEEDEEDYSEDYEDEDDEEEDDEEEYDDDDDDDDDDDESSEEDEYEDSDDESDKSDVS